VGALVGPGQLGTYLQQPVRADSEDVAIAVAEGWLYGACTALASWPPDPVPPDLRAWCLELAGIAYTNPEGLATRTVGDDTHMWILSRRAEILKAATIRYGGARPQGSFPEALDWPDGPHIPATWSTVTANE
jgi:hypothetical protein